MSDSITCICGYRGPSVVEAGRAVCPICRTAASGRRPAAPAAPSPPRAVPEPSGFAPSPPPAAAAEASGTVTYRIPCPRGHVLKASAAMLDQQVVCPQCNEVFVLRYTDSREYKKEKEREDSRREAEMAELWLKRAIWAAVFIVVSLAGMIAFSFIPR